MGRFALVAMLLAACPPTARAQSAKGQPAVAALLATLSEDPSPRVRAQAALALKARAGEVVPALLAALQDASPVVRAAAARALSDAAPASAWPALVTAARDTDALVARWARSTACRVLGRASRVRLDVRRLATYLGTPSDWAEKVFQEEVLTTLLAPGRFELTKEIDFSDEAPAPDELRVQDWSKGPVFADPAQPVAAAPVDVALRGTAGVIERTSEGVRVRVDLDLLSATGAPLWHGDAEAVARPRRDSPDGDADGAESGELVAMRTASREAARRLLAALVPRPVDVGATDRPGP